jgi:ribosomal protein S18 acetylase RimI-like enzyme
MEYSECLPLFESAVRSLRIRLAELRDLSKIVSIHAEAFPNAFLTLLGSDFLAQYYSAVLTDAGGILLVASEQAKMVGFVAGILNPRKFYSEMRSHATRYAVSVITGVLRRPYLITKVYSNFRRLSSVAARNTEIAGCELTSIAVAPRSQGRGIGQDLIGQFLVQAWARGAGSVYLTTDTNNNANVLYRRSGFQLRRTFGRSDHRQMNEYVISRPVRN